MANLETIWRVSISNEDTKRLIARIMGTSQKSSRCVELTVDDDLFFALLATDNGRGLARMLGDYPEMFGRKALISAKVWQLTSMPDICWLLGDLPDIRSIPSTPRSRTTTARTPDSKRSRKGRRVSERQTV